MIGLLGVFSWTMVPLLFVYWYLPHFVIDYFTSRYSAKQYEANNESKFWATIGFDQYLHQIQILLFILIVS